jgi:hypothetical protein
MNDKTNDKETILIPGRKVIKIDDITDTVNVSMKEVNAQDGGLTKEVINEVITTIATRFLSDILVLSEDELKARWRFKWDCGASVEWNTYKFNGELESYKRVCRQWEEHHNGNGCVVERVRDKYLMPKVKEFLALLITESQFQSQVQSWMTACFGHEISNDKTERNHRFLEESLELVQACGCTQHEAHQLVDYVYGRPTGEPHQEVGGVMVTLAALCLAQDLNMHVDGETELARVWTKIEQIREKQAAKPKHRPLPV